MYELYWCTLIQFCIMQLTSTTYSKMHYIPVGVSVGHWEFTCGCTAWQVVGRGIVLCSDYIHIPRSRAQRWLFLPQILYCYYLIHQFLGFEVFLQHVFGMPAW